jgi:hypothetical protein
MAVQIAFVAAPATSPTITLSLTQTDLRVKRDSFTLGAPEFEGDPYSVNAGYGDRTVEMTLQATGTYDEAATLFQDVSQQIVQGAPGMGGRNWLMFRWSPSDPLMFLQTLPSSFQPVDFSNAGANVWEMPLSVVCDGYILGAPEDISSFVITNNPASGTNRMIAGPATDAKFGAIKGDAPTPLLCGMTASTSGFIPNYVTSYSVRGSTHALLARNLTELTSGTDVGAPVTGAGANYIDGDYKSCSFASGGLAVRLSGNFSTTLTPMPGLYRAILKGAVPSLGAGTAVNTFSFQLSLGGDSTQFGPLTPLTMSSSVGTDRLGMVDLGLFQVPVGVEYGGIGPTAPATAVAANLFVEIDASVVNVSGATSAFRFDELILIPTETVYGFARVAILPLLPPTSDVLMFDGIADSVRNMDDTGSGTFSATPVVQAAGNAPTWQGGLPMVAPNSNNYLHVLLPGGNTPASTTTWAARYYPRYVQPRPSAT